MENKTQKAVENITSILNGFTAAEIQEILFLVNEKCNANYVLVLEKKEQLEDSDQLIKCHISVNSYKREWQESLSDFIKKIKQEYGKDHTLVFEIHVADTKEI